MKPKPILVMRIHPEGSTLYHEVWVYRTLKDMRKAEGGWTTAGWCKYDNKRAFKPASSRRVGRVCLSATRLGARIVTHEMTHATFQYLVAKGVDVLDVHDANERTCYIVGDMTAEFYIAARRVGLVE